MSEAVKKVGYLGSEGSYSHQAATRMAPGADYEGFSTFAKLVAATETPEVSHAVIPIENSISGRIPDVHRLMVNMKLFIAAELLLPIEHCLIVPKRNGALHDISTLDRIETIYSHPQGFIQCQAFLEGRLPGRNAIHTSDTASAVKKIAEEGSETAAAIGSPFAARHYGAVVIQEHISDRRDNLTRFLLLSKTFGFDAQDADMTTMIFQVGHEPGALVSALGVFARHQINLTKLETYMISDSTILPTFYIDIGVGMGSRQLKEALAEFETVSSYMKLLGSYAASKDRKAKGGFLPPTC